MRATVGCHEKEQEQRGKSEFTHRTQFETFHVDARIPRLYITHGRMPHNESSPTMFRIGFIQILLVIIWCHCCRRSAVVSLPRRAARSFVPQASQLTKTGIDVLEEQNFAPLRGKRVGLISNQTGVDSQGRRSIDVLAHADGVKLVALFSPEHGIAGKLDAAKVANATDDATGLRIYSLYGDTRRPTDAMLQGLDALVFDIQGAGVRFYTFITTMGYCMEAAGKHKHSVLRPGPARSARRRENRRSDARSRRAFPSLDIFACRSFMP